MNEILKRIDQEIISAKELEQKEPSNTMYSSLITKLQEKRVNLMLKQVRIKFRIFGKRATTRTKCSICKKYSSIVIFKRDLDNNCLKLCTECWSGNK
ncbi:hypothetical protein LCGC14_0619150 [marine sediment metagenome]|uniref:Uncharacterized protein n=1 Tax=marine sediment metagenome TaxID=412755 RepID=A0A0F9R5I8_9ZZZZ